MIDRDQLRRQIEEDLAAQRFSVAQSGLERLWRTHPSAALAAFVNGRYEQLRGHTSCYPVRVAVLRSFTVEPVLPLLRATAWTERLDVTVRAGEFNAYAPELLDPQSWVYSFTPDVVILAVQTRDVAPDLWDGFADRTADDARATVERVLEDFRTWVRVFRSRSQAYLLLHNMELPAQPSRGILDAQSGGSQADAIRAINDGLRYIAGEFPGVYIFDYDSLTATRGRCAWRDEQRFATVKLPLRAESMLALAREWTRYLCPIAGRAAKVLAVDLDNTLWGGVVGEDGASGLHADREHPGIAWWNVQRALLDVKRRGILLAICSKNNREDALDAFRANPAMPLRLEDFAADRINWVDKPANLREIAAELNVGIDSVAFLDDNPTERDRVRRELPEVTVIDLPDDPLEFAAAIRSCPVLERLAVSQEDADRSRYYAQQRQRSTAQESAANVEEFYRSLFQKVEIARVNAASIARAAQLTQKTNQFNATTRRYSEQQMAAIAETPGSDIYTVRVTDRFGDNGLVGVMVTREAEPGTAEIDTFLLSCRVIARTVETAMLSFLAEESRARGLAALRGWFLPTAKNAPASDVYRKHGFAAGSSTESGTCWTFDLQRAEIACPDWIELTVPPSAWHTAGSATQSTSKGPMLSEYSAS
jgi:FkbH-like protein